MEFDTRDKKPKVFSLLIVAVVEAVILVLLFLAGIEQRAALGSATLAAAFLAAVVILIIAFFRQLEYNPYSYNTIYYSGFSLLFLFIAIMFLSLMANQIQYPDLFRMSYAISLLMTSAQNFMLYTSPFILAFSVLLFISNIALLRHERKRLVNVLGIVLSFLLVFGEVFGFLFNYYVSGSETEVLIHDLVGNLFAAIYLYVECMLIGVIIADLIAAKHNPSIPRDFLIVLGCRVQPDGTPTPILRDRLNRALAFYKQQLEETGKELIFVTSGGKGADELVSESACMKRYLMEHGIPEEQIIEEDASVSTKENMLFSREKILAANPDGAVCFSTSNYHVFRSGLYARRVKMRAVGMGAKTKWYFWPNAAVREFVGLLTEHRLKQGLIIGSLILIFAAMTLAQYFVF